MEMKGEREMERVKEGEKEKDREKMMARDLGENTTTSQQMK